MNGMFYKIGGIGALIWYIGLVLAIIGGIGFGASLIPEFALVGAIGGIIVVVGIILASLSAFAFYKHFKNILPLLTFIFGLIAGIILIINTILAFAGVGGLANLIIGILAMILLGVFLILYGIFFILFRYKLPETKLMLVMGIVLLIAGCLHASIIGASFGIAYFALIPGLVMLMEALLLKEPIVAAAPARPKPKLRPA